jgi:hypothetical protein
MKNSCQCEFLHWCENFQNGAKDLLCLDNVEQLLLTMNEKITSKGIFMRVGKFLKQTERKITSMLIFPLA